MRVQLTNECTTDSSNLQCNGTGYYCTSCEKQVVDYSGMTDAQMLASVRKHGLGCGAFRSEQLNRELLSQPRRLTWKMVYASVVALFLLKSPDVTAQTKPVVEQAPAEPRDTFVVLQSLDGLQTTAYSTTSKRFGGAIAIRSQHLTLWMRIRKFFTTNKAK